MKILHLTPFYEPAWAYGGMARAAACLCRALVRRGHDVTVATALFDAAHPKEEWDGRLHVLRFPALFKRRLVPWAPGLHRFLGAELATTEVAHLHGHRSGMALTACRVLEASGVPWVLQSHGTYPHHSQHALAKWAADRIWGDGIVRQARSLLALSQSEARDLPRRALVVGSGVEALGGLARSEHDEGPEILFVGSDQPQKRGKVLPALLQALPGVRLRLAGRFGPRFRRLFRPFSDRVIIQGVMEGAALATAYASADLVVHPAVGEAFGLVPFEAALQGTPGVVAGGHGCGEWYGLAGGCVVPADDPVALAEAVRARLANRELAEREVRAVADFTRLHLTWERVAKRVEAAYEEIRAAPPDAGP